MREDCTKKWDSKKFYKLQIMVELMNSFDLKIYSCDDGVRFLHNR